MRQVNHIRVMALDLRFDLRGVVALSSVCLLLFLSGCATGETAFRQGDYAEAARVSADRLSRQPNAESAREVFLNAYPQARAEWLSRAESARRDSADPFRWERVYEAYEVLRDLANRAALTPFAGQGDIVIDYFLDEIEEAKVNAATARIEFADNLLKEGDLYQARAAYEHYTVAMRYAGQREDIQRKLDAAHVAGTSQLGIDPVVARGHGLNPEELTAAIVSDFSEHRIHFFVEAAASSSWDDREADQYLEVVIGEMSIVREESEVGERIVHHELPPRPEGEEPREVSATIVTREKRIVASCPVTLSVFDVARDQWVFERDVVSQSLWSSQWEVVLGDRRAIVEEELRLAEPPDPELTEMAQDLARHVVDDVRANLRAHFQ